MGLQPEKGLCAHVKLVRIRTATSVAGGKAANGDPTADSLFCERVAGHKPGRPFRKSYWKVRDALVPF